MRETPSPMHSFALIGLNSHAYLDESCFFTEHHWILPEHESTIRNSKAIISASITLSAEQALGEQHPDTAQTLSNLAYLYHHQDQFEEAMHFLQRSLSIRQQVLGMEHPDTATSLNALALLYRDQGRYEEAEPFFQQALAIRKQIFGTEHPQTAHSLSNLAWLYRNLGKYHEAELLYEQSLTIRKRILRVEIIQKPPRA